jgi:CheY-like chemotaxis protein
MQNLVLIADDDLDNREIGKEILEANGYNVMIAKNGIDVLELARQHKPDIILMDLSMPKIDGWQATKLLKGDDDTKGIVIIAYTAHASKADEQKALAAKCDDYISKPCHPQALLAKISDWVERIKQKDSGK